MALCRGLYSCRVRRLSPGMWPMEAAGSIGPAGRLPMAVTLGRLRLDRVRLMRLLRRRLRPLLPLRLLLPRLGQRHLARVGALTTEFSRSGSLVLVLRSRQACVCCMRMGHDFGTDG